MENLVLVTISKERDNILTTTSLKVAKAFEKRHDHVMRDIELLTSQNLGGLVKFWNTPYTHPQNGQTYYYYEMNQEAFTLLVMGYTGSKALGFKLKYMNAFNQMRDLLNSDAYIIDRAMRIMVKSIEEKTVEIAELQEANTFLEIVIKEQAEDVAYAKKVLTATNAWNITTIAKELDTTAIALNKSLCEMGIQFKQDNHYVLSARYNGQGFTKTKTYTYTNRTGETITNIQTTWTEKGRNFIHNLIKKFNGQGVARLAN